MQLIDTHAHLYAEQFDEDRDAMVEKAVAAGVDKFFLPNIDKGSIEGMHKLVEQYPDRMYPMMGLHPCSIKKDSFEGELTIVEERLSNYKYKGVGEIGLDYYWDKSNIEEQKEALKIQLALARQYELPVILHSRDSFDDLIEIIENYGEGLSGIFHCFTGNVEQAERVIRLKTFYMGIGGVLTFKNSGLDKTIENINLEHLVLETDAPYLAPAPFRGKRNESAFITLVAEKIAEIKNIDVTEVATATTLNAKKLFRI